MNENLRFTNKDISELIYLLHNAPIDISYKDKRIIPMNGLWYPSNNGEMNLDAFENFHDAVCWLLNPFWEQANGHPYI